MDAAKRLSGCVFWGPESWEALLNPGFQLSWSPYLRLEAPPFSLKIPSGRLVVRPLVPATAAVPTDVVLLSKGKYFKNLAVLFSADKDIHNFHFLMLQTTLDRELFGRRLQTLCLEKEFRCMADEYSVDDLSHHKCQPNTQLWWVCFPIRKSRTLFHRFHFKGLPIGHAGAQISNSTCLSHISSDQSDASDVRGPSRLMTYMSPAADRTNVFPRDLGRKDMIRFDLQE